LDFLQFNCVHFRDEYKIYFVSGDTNYRANEQLSGSWVPGVWHRVKIDYDYSNLRANVYLDGVLIGQNISMSPKEATWEYQGTHHFTLRKVGVLHGEGNNIYVDDFSVEEIPCVSPQANFTASPTSGTPPLTANFTDQSTNNPTSWSWNFGDGATSSLKNPSHTYTSTGTYTISLSASNNSGSDTETKVNYITVSSTGLGG